MSVRDTESPHTACAAGRGVRGGHWPTARQAEEAPLKLVKSVELLCMDSHILEKSILWL